jgi:hypothetical protein
MDQLGSPLVAVYGEDKGEIALQAMVQAAAASRCGVSEGATHVAGHVAEMKAATLRDISCALSGEEGGAAALPAGRRKYGLHNRPRIGRVLSVPR